MRTLLAALVLVATMVQAPTVRVRWARGTDFSAYQTFTWAEGTSAVDPQIHQLIIESVENELSVAGIFPDESEPDPLRHLSRLRQGGVRDQRRPVA